MSLYKTGLIHSPEPPRFRFGAYVVPQLLPPTPATFGHQDIYGRRDWEILGNDRVGDCTVAGALHAIMLWRKVVNQPVQFSTMDALDDYFAITGGKDRGADMVTMSDYWRKTGFRDRTATRHKILAYMHVDADNLEHIDAACFLFDVVGLGIRVGQADMIAFSRNQPWVDPDTTADTYHYVPMVGKDAKYRYIVTWGGLVPVSELWLKGRLDEVVAVLSEENLLAGKSLEGLDANALEADLEALAA